MATSRLEDQLSFRPKINKRSSLQHSGQKQRASGESRIEVGSLTHMYSVVRTVAFPTCATGAQHCGLRFLPFFLH